MHHLDGVHSIIKSSMLCDMDALFEQLIAQAIDVTDATEAYLFIVDPNTGFLHLRKAEPEPSLTLTLAKPLQYPLSPLLGGPSLPPFSEAQLLSLYLAPVSCQRIFQTPLTFTLTLILLSPSNPSISCSHSVSLTDLAASSLSINYNFLTLTLALAQTRFAHLL